MRPAVVKLISLHRYPIYKQLVLEEALLRNHAGNWCILNDGAAHPSIVLGVSGKLHEWVDAQAAASAGIEVLKRFSGGGTVVVDDATLFATLVMGREAVPHVEPFPRPIMAWTEGLYTHVFKHSNPHHGAFALRDNDYVFGAHKFGGNAQAITGGRWVHHTSFLWDYKPERMALLKPPPRSPEYRQGRAHGDFLVRLKDVMDDRQAVLRGVGEALERLGFVVQDASLEEAAAALHNNTMINTKRIW